MNEEKERRRREEIEELKNARSDLFKALGIGEESASNDSLDGSSKTSSNRQSRGHALTLASNAQKVNHSDYNKNGFATYIIMALLVAFASGAIVSALYIFNGLGNMIFSL